MEDLNRFLAAQKEDYEQALAEIKAGRKQTHWMWYIFPQLKGLGRSHMADYYGLKGLEEAKAYLQNETLRGRLMEITQALLDLRESDPEKVMGDPDHLKLCSSMTLFMLAEPECPLFGRVLDKYFGGKQDRRTLELLKK